MQLEQERIFEIYAAVDAKIRLYNPNCIASGLNKVFHNFNV